MNTRLMRKLDTALGLPIAWAMGAFRFRHSPRPSSPRNVVVVKLFGLGSIVVAGGALRAFRKAQPQARMTLVTFAAHRDLEPLLGVFDEIIPLRHDRPGHLGADICRAIARLRGRPPDLVIDLEFFSKLTTVFCACAKSGHHLGFQLPARWRHRLLDGGIAFREDIHFGECVARLLAPWGVDYHGRLVPELRIPEPARVAAGRMLTELSSSNATPPTGPWIFINPHAQDMSPERQWPAEYFAALIGQLAVRIPSSRFGILGLVEQWPASERLRKRTAEAIRPRVHVLAGQTSLPVLAALLQRAALLVTNDSGIMHFGAAAQAPLVALFGPESPLRYGPLASPDLCRVLSADVVCGPCLTYMNRKQAPCAGDNQCMRSLPVERVLNAALDLVGNPGAIPA